MKNRNTIVILLIITFVFLCLSGTTQAGSPATLISPANNYDCVDPANAVFLWHKPSGSVGFGMQLSTRSDMGDTIYMNYASDTTRILTSLVSGATFYWRVQTPYPDFTAPWSTVWSFKTRVLPPNISVPSDNATCLLLNVLFSWTSYANSTFRLQVSTSNTFATTVFDSSGIKINSATARVPNNATKYYWRLNLSSLSGCTTDWSVVRSFTTVQTAPSNSVPNDKAINVSLRAYLKWNVTGSPRSNRVQVATDSDFINVVYDNFANRNYDTAQLAVGNTTHYWRIKSSYTDCETDWSKFFSFTTLDAQTSTVIPNLDSSCIPLTQRFEWLPVAGITAYRLQISELNSFANLVINRGNIRNSFDTASVPKGLQQYFWRVRAEDNLNTGQWSDTSRFRTAVTPPVRLSPYNKQDSLPKPITFRWNNMGTGILYHIQISNSNDFTTPMVDKVVDVDTFFYRLPDYFKTYYWRMSAQKETCYGSWSSVWQFKVVMSPPKQLTPPDSSTNLLLSVTFTWDTPDGAEKFSYQLSKNYNFSGTLLIGKTGMTTNTITVTKELEPLTTYYWRVNAVSALGTSYWSKTFTFSTGDKGPSTPVLVSPPDGTRSLPAKVTLTWNPAAKAKVYHLQFADNSQFSNPIVDDYKISATSYEVNLLKYGMVYYWQVSAINDSGKSNWSPTWSFFTRKMIPSDAPLLKNPVNNISDVSPTLTFTWDTVARADNYDFQLTDKPDFDSGLIYNDSTLTNNAKYVEGLSNNTIFSWRTRARNDAGTGPWSDTWKFKSMVSSVEQFSESNYLSLSINPNPISDNISINYQLPFNSNVIITVINQLGEEITKLEQGNKEQGKNNCQLSIVNYQLTDGIYFVKLQAGNIFEIKKFVILR